MVSALKQCIVIPVVLKHGPGNPAYPLPPPPCPPLEVLETLKGPWVKIIFSEILRHTLPLFLLSFSNDLEWNIPNDRLDTEADFRI